jgi:hypothetical protein
VNLCFALALLAFFLRLFDVRHHALSSLNLSLGEFVSFTRVGIVPGPQLNPDWRAVEFQHPAKGFFEIPGITGRQGLGLTTVNHDNGGVLAPRMRVSQLDTPPIGEGGRVAGHSIFQYAGQAMGIQGCSCSLMGLMNGIVQMPYTGTMQGGDEMNVSVVDKLQAAIEF